MKRLSIFVLGLMAVVSASAGELLLSDFNSDAVGKAYSMYNIWGNVGDSKTEVCVSPTDSKEKVLHVTTKNWNTFVHFDLPENLHGESLMDYYQAVEYDIYRAPSMESDWMQMVALMTGTESQTLYWDEGYPFQDNKGKWEHRRFDFTPSVTLTGNGIAIGIHSDNAEYYIDNVRLVGITKKASGNVRWTGAVSNVWDTVTENFEVQSADGKVQSVFANANSVVFDDDVTASSPVNITIAAGVEPFDVTFNGKAKEYRFTGQPISGGGRLTVNDGKKVTFGVANTLAGGSFLKNGSLWSASVSQTKPFGEFVVVDKGELHFNFSNTSSQYVNIDVPIYINEGGEIDVYTSRYTYWMSPVVGKGTVNIHCGGERSYAGNAKGAAFPNWTGFEGTVNIVPDKSVIGNAGFYGLVLGHGNKTFLPDEVEQCLVDYKYNTMFEKSVLNLTSGATLACESGVRAFRIAHLDMAADAQVMGYYKSDSKSKSYFIVGRDDTDAVLPGKFYPASTSNGLGLVKEGKGTYTLTGKENLINAGLKVMDGSVFVDGKTMTTATVYPKALLGGTGIIDGNVDVYGKLRPGNDEIGTLTVAKNGKLFVRPTSVLLFRIANNQNDKLNIEGSIEYSKKLMDFTESDLTPVIKPVFGEDFNYIEGAEYVLLTVPAAGNRLSITDNTPFFRIANPDPIKWNVMETVEDDGTYTVILKAEKSTNPNDVSYNIDEEDNGDENFDYEYETDFDYTDRGDATPLREYAEQLGKYIGVAIPVWRVNVDDDNDPRTKAVYEDFNLCVAENEMKIDALQPNQGEFNFYHGDRLCDFAARHNMRVRGHTLVWHSQVPQWMSVDGKKNDKNWTREQALDILKTHITTVMQHYKGKVYEWDVINEMLDDDQSIVRTNPDGYNLRSSVWLKAIGEAYLDSALVYAHRADPDAKLFINEYGAEMQGRAKSEAYYNLAKRLKASGIPLDGVGLQCHLTVGELDSVKFDNQVRRFADLGLNCHITELDLSMPDLSDYNRHKLQAREYRKITNTMLRYDHSENMIIWGITDDQSWRQGEPLLFNSRVEKKPAFWAVRNAVANHKATGINVPANHTSYFINHTCHNLQGQKVDNNYRGIIIRGGKKVINNKQQITNNK